MWSDRATNGRPDSVDEEGEGLDHSLRHFLLRLLLLFAQLSLWMGLIWACMCQGMLFVVKVKSQVSPDICRCTSLAGGVCNQPSTLEVERLL